MITDHEVRNRELLRQRLWADMAEYEKRHEVYQAEYGESANAKSPFVEYAKRGNKKSQETRYGKPRVDPKIYELKQDQAFIDSITGKWNKKKANHKFQEKI